MIKILIVILYFFLFFSVSVFIDATSKHSGISVVGNGPTNTEVPESLIATVRKTWC